MINTHRVGGLVVFLSVTMEAGVLKPDEFGVRAVLLLQTLMGALLHHLSPPQEHHLVGQLHTAHLVGNEQHGATVRIGQEGLVHLRAKRLHFRCSVMDKRRKDCGTHVINDLPETRKVLGLCY